MNYEPERPVRLDVIAFGILTFLFWLVVMAAVAAGINDATPGVPDDVPAYELPAP